MSVLSVVLLAVIFIQLRKIIFTLHMIYNIFLYLVNILKGRIINRLRMKAKK